MYSLLISCHSVKNGVSVHPMDHKWKIRFEKFVLMKIPGVNFSYELDETLFFEKYQDIFRRNS
jgi:hypothetical protein